MYSIVGQRMWSILWSNSLQNSGGDSQIATLQSVRWWQVEVRIPMYTRVLGLCQTDRCDSSLPFEGGSPTGDGIDTVGIHLVVGSGVR